MNHTNPPSRQFSPLALANSTRPPDYIAILDEAKDWWSHITPREKDVATVPTAFQGAIFSDTEAALLTETPPLLARARKAYHTIQNGPEDPQAPLRLATAHVGSAMLLQSIRDHVRNGGSQALDAYVHTRGEFLHRDRIAGRLSQYNGFLVDTALRYQSMPPKLLRRHLARTALADLPTNLFSEPMVDMSVQSDIVGIQSEASTIAAFSSHLTEFTLERASSRRDRPGISMFITLDGREVALDVRSSLKEALARKFKHAQTKDLFDNQDVILEQGFYFDRDRVVIGAPFVRRQLLDTLTASKADQLSAAERLRPMLYAIFNSLPDEIENMHPDEHYNHLEDLTPPQFRDT